jgi:hypothetical protein
MKNKIIIGASIVLALMFCVKVIYNATQFEYKADQQT